MQAACLLLLFSWIWRSMQFVFCKCKWKVPSRGQILNGTESVRFQILWLTVSKPDSIFNFAKTSISKKKPSCCPLNSRDQETHLMASSHLRSYTHLWHIRLCTMERQASAEVGALLLMSWPRSSLPHGSDPGLGSDKAEITSLDGGLTSSAPVCRCQLSEMEKFY